MSFRAVLFDIGGPIDMELAWEMAVDSAIASACGLEGIRVDQDMIDAASERAVAVFVPDVYAAMVEDLCGGDPASVARVNQRRRAMVAALDVFQMRPDMPALLRRLKERGLMLVANQPERLARQDIAGLFTELMSVPPSECIMVGDRIDIDIAPAKARGMATVLFRSGRYRRQRPRSPAEEPDAVVTDVRELEEAISTLLAQ